MHFSSSRYSQRGAKGRSPPGPDPDPSPKDPLEPPDLNKLTGPDPTPLRRSRAAEEGGVEGFPYKPPTRSAEPLPSRGPALGEAFSH